MRIKSPETYSLTAKFKVCTLGYSDQQKHKFLSFPLKNRHKIKPELKFMLANKFFQKNCWRNVSIV